MKKIIVWYRQDLRVEDHPPLHEAVSHGALAFPLYIYAPEEGGNWPIGSASKWWLHYSLLELDEALHELNLSLTIRKGPSKKALIDFLHETEAEEIYCNRLFEPAFIERDAKIAEELQKMGVRLRYWNSSLLIDPWNLLTKEMTPFKVFTPFWKKCQEKLPPEEPLKPLKSEQKNPKKLPSLRVEELELLPKIDWDSGLEKAWQPGCREAKKRVNQAKNKVVENYLETRDFPSLLTSRLSPSLHFGEVSPRMIWHAIAKCETLPEKSRSGFLRQLGWREFGHYLLHHFPKTPEEPLYPKYRKITETKNREGLKAWCEGKTGYPIVDAGMRELWQTGWMHNRVRMIVGSFLVKDLFISWREGASWFWDTLVDADLANNTLGWQWVAGCGADAAPYFRIFNPILQGEKFDPEGLYIKRYLPELESIPAKWIHRPFEAPEEEQRRWRITLGKEYPLPIVSHKEARDKALALFNTL